MLGYDGCIVVCGVGLRWVIIGWIVVVGFVVAVGIVLRQRHPPLRDSLFDHCKSHYQVYSYNGKRHCEYGLIPRNPIHETPQ